MFSGEHGKAPAKYALTTCLTFLRRCHKKQLMSTTLSRRVGIRIIAGHLHEKMFSIALQVRQRVTFRHSNQGARRTDLVRA